MILPGAEEGVLFLGQSIPERDTNPWRFRSQSTPPDAGPMQSNR